MENKNYKKNISDNIRILRTKYRISQETLAEKADISHHYIYQIENEQVNPSIEIMLKISEALDVTLNDLVY